jgi:hypothetical protein
MSDKDGSILSTLLNILKDRPDFILMLIVVGGFLVYIERKEIRDVEQAEKEAARLDMVAEQRIGVCHDIQHQGIEAMKENTNALILHAEKDSLLSEKVETMTITVSGNTTALHGLEIAVERLIETVDAHRELAYETRRHESRYDDE